MSDIEDEWGHVTPEALVKGFTELFNLLADDILASSYEEPYPDLKLIYDFIQERDKHTGMAVIYEGIRHLASTIRLHGLVHVVKDQDGPLGTGSPSKNQPLRSRDSSDSGTASS